MVLRNMRKSVCSGLAGTILASSIMIGSATTANGMIVGAAYEDRAAFFTGLVFLFLLPPLGLVLNGEPMVQDMYQKLPFLKSTQEGREIEQRIKKLVSDRTEQVTQQVQQIPDQTQRRQKAEQILQRQQSLQVNTQKKEFYVRLTQEEVLTILEEDKGYTQEQIQQAVQVLCR